jgi:cell division protein FtsB
MTKIRQLSGFFSFTMAPRRARIAQPTWEQMMSIGSELKRRGRLLAAPAIFLAITGYFGWNATQGDRGLVAHAQRRELLRQVVADQAAARAERDGWETRVSGLRARHLNPDTLNERARAMLNLSEPSEVIVKLGPKDKLF